MIHHPTVRGFEWRDTPFGSALVSKALEPVARHLFTTRALSLRGEAADEHWSALAEAMGVEPRHLFAPQQVHGRDVLVVGDGDIAPASLNDPRRPHADIILTTDRGSAIAVQAADCVPILLADRRNGAVGAAHAGWRGTAAAVARVAIQAMEECFGSRPADIVAVIGPSIGRCCYQVGPDVRDAFASWSHPLRLQDRWFTPDASGGRFRLDVALANRDQLELAGVSPEQIASCGLCTACHAPLFFSYRRDGAGTGRLAAAIRFRGA